MQIQNLYPGSWGSNCYLLISGTHAAVVDPSAKAETILHAIAQAGCTLDMILLTHGHFDHMLAADALSKLPAYGRIDKETTFNVGTISGGTSVNTIAQHAEMLY